MMVYCLRLSRYTCYILFLQVVLYIHRIVHQFPFLIIVLLILHLMQYNNSLNIRLITKYTLLKYFYYFFFYYFTWRSGTIPKVLPNYYYISNHRK